MATYVELHAIRNSVAVAPLMQKISMAVAIKANAIAKSATPTATAKAWALKALENPESQQQIVLNYILADNNTVAATAITGAADSLVQTAVNAAVDTLLGV